MIVVISKSFSLYRACLFHSRQSVLWSRDSDRIRNSWQHSCAKVQHPIICGWLCPSWSLDSWRWRGACAVLSELWYAKTWLLQNLINVLFSSHHFEMFPVVAQFYVTEAENEYVIRGNSAVMKCKIPSFVADFVSVESWVADDGQVHTYTTTSDNYGNGQWCYWCWSYMNLFQLWRSHTKQKLTTNMWSVETVLWWSVRYQASWLTLYLWRCGWTVQATHTFLALTMVMNVTAIHFLSAGPFPPLCCHTFSVRSSDHLHLWFYSGAAVLPDQSHWWVCSSWQHCNSQVFDSEFHRRFCASCWMGHRWWLIFGIFYVWHRLW